LISIILMGNSGISFRFLCAFGSNGAVTTIMCGCCERLERDPSCVVVVATTIAGRDDVLADCLGGNEPVAANFDSANGVLDFDVVALMGDRKISSKSLTMSELYLSM
jgi:hypothetical protein